MEVIILIGLQGAGKTTFLQKHFAETHAHVSRDHFRNNRNPSRRQRELILEALRAGRSVVVDNTNAGKADRAAICQAARAHKAQVRAYFFVPDVKGCIERNHRREGVAKVPVVAIHATKKRLEAPTYEEDLDLITEVHLDEERQVTVTVVVPKAPLAQPVVPSAPALQPRG